MTGGYWHNLALIAGSIIQTGAVYRAAWDSFYAYDGDDENATCQTNILFGSDYLTNAIAAEVARRVDEALAEVEWLRAHDRRVAAEALRAAARREVVEVYSPALRVRAVLVDALLERAKRVEAGDE